MKNLDSKNVKKVVYVYDEELENATSCIPHLENRAKMVHELIKAYGLTDFMDCRPSILATEQDLLTFHSSAYLDSLSAADQSSESLSCTDEDEFGLGYDCPTFKNMTDFACRLAGGTLSAVNAIIEGSKVSINWCGGWHHAQRNEASGFCYVNDIVIGIQVLLKNYKRVLYIDLDSHHGDGVENAFSYSNKVSTFSIHNYETGYFPGTGNFDNVGFGKGKYYSVNVPLRSGLTDEQFMNVFDEVFARIDAKFCPEVLVVQCGADCLAGDPLGNFNLSEKSLGYCVKEIMKRDKPTIFLGGGGYNLVNTSKAWTYLTSIILNQDLSYDIPDNEFFLEYGSDFTLNVVPNLRKNENTAGYLSQLLNNVRENIDRIAIVQNSV